MDFLADRGLQPTFGHLRLAFLLGPSAAAKVLQAAPTMPVSRVLDGSVIAANPFMRRMTVADLVARATRDVSPRQPAGSQQVARVEPAAPAAPAEPAAPAAPAEPAPPVATADAVPAVAAQPPQPLRVADAESAALAPQPEQPEAAADAAPAPSAQKEEPAATVRADAPRPAERRAAAPARRAAARQSGGRIVINVTCNEKLASCRRWIDEQVAKAVRMHTASDDTRRGA
jgi:outer membrane biosynthesis protein TonB